MATSTHAVLIEGILVILLVLVILVLWATLKQSSSLSHAVQGSAISSSFQQQAVNDLFRKAGQQSIYCRQLAQNNSSKAVVTQEAIVYAIYLLSEQIGALEGLLTSCSPDALQKWTGYDQPKAFVQMLREQRHQWIQRLPATYALMLEHSDLNLKISPPVEEQKEEEENVK